MKEGGLRGVESGPEGKDGGQRKGLGLGGRGGTWLGPELCWDLEGLVGTRALGWVDKGEPVGTGEQGGTGRDPGGTREQGSAGRDMGDKRDPV